MQSGHGARWFASAACTAVFLSCGGGGDPEVVLPLPSDPGQAAAEPHVSATLKIASDGVHPKAAAVHPGERVRFVNEDQKRHQIVSDPHVAHSACPELNGPVLEPGMAFTAKLADHEETCGFHDDEAPDDTALQGTITVSKSGAAGDGGLLDGAIAQ